MDDGVVTGPGSSAVIPEVVRRCADGISGRRPRIVMVTSGGFDRRSWSAGIRRSVREFAPQWFSQCGTPRPDGVATLAQQLREYRADVIVAIGGGSVLDAAKAAVRLSGADRIDAEAVVAACTGRYRPLPVNARLVAVPTTPGTGAEVTPFASVWQPERNRKLSLSGPEVKPTRAVLDPDLLHGLSAADVGAGVLDTLCQGAEAAWSIRATAESTGLGLAAVGLVGAVLDRLDPEHPGDAGRLTLQLAGHLSGRAIALAPTSSCHALSYPLTLRAGLAHGHACGVTFGRLLRYNAAVTEEDCADPRGATRVRNVIDRVVAALGATDPADAERRVEAFLTRAGLRTLDHIRYDRKLLAREALAYPRCADNPRTLTVPGLIRQLDLHLTEEPCR